MKDIAESLGLAVITVSKALRDHSDISRETKERVWAKARDLHYTPNLAARSLVTQQSYVVGLVVPELMISYFGEVAKAISAQMRLHGYEVFLSSSEGDPATEEQEIERLLGRNVDGLIIATSSRMDESAVFERLAAMRVPFVLIDRHVQGVKCIFVGSDDRLIGKIATNHLIEIGCRQIAHLHGPLTSTGVGRSNGYTAALAKAGRDSTDLLLPGGTSDESGYSGMVRLLSSSRPDGVFCYNDLVAAGAMRCCHERGIAIPDQVAFIGCGNHRLTDQLRVPLSTVDQQSARIGEKAAQQLLRKLTSADDLKPQRVLVPPIIVLRQSTNRTRSTESHRKCAQL